MLEPRVNDGIGSHVKSAALEAYVLGALDAHVASGVEAHVLDCPSCADALAREARLEGALAMVASRASAPAKVPHARRPARPLGFAGGAAAVLAAAAVLLVWIAAKGEPPPSARYGAAVRDASGAFAAHDARAHEGLDALQEDALDGG